MIEGTAWDYEFIFVDDGQDRTCGNRPAGVLRWKFDKTAALAAVLRVLSSRWMATFSISPTSPKWRTEGRGGALPHRCEQLLPQPAMAVSDASISMTPTTFSNGESCFPMLTALWRNAPVHTGWHGASICEIPIHNQNSEEP